MRWTEFAVREARQTLAHWQQHVGVLTPPIAVEDIADLQYHLALDTTTLLPDGMAGRLFVEQRIIEVRREDMLPRQRFTIAHEIGHYCLHVLAEKLHLDGHGCSVGVMVSAEDVPEPVMPGFGPPTPPQRPQLSAQDARRIEIEANAFAAEVLMPAALIEQAVMSLGTDVDALAQAFLVSRQAMQYRLEKLLLLPPRGPQTSFL